MMINYARVSFLISVVYVFCFQFFLSSGSLAWLYAGNLLFGAVAALHIFFYQSAYPTLSLPASAKKGIALSFRSSMIALCGCVILLGLRIYTNPAQQTASLNINAILKNISSFSILLFTNSFLINMVSGSLASLFTAGMMNEKNCFNSSKPLPSVK